MSDRARMTGRSYAEGRSGKYDALAHVCCSNRRVVDVAWHDRPVKPPIAQYLILKRPSETRRPLLKLAVV